MFYSRPQLPQLGLDLAEVDGGLGRPSQYRGRTTDGRAVRLGYDRGKLSVAIEDGPDGLRQPNADDIAKAMPGDGRQPPQPVLAHETLQDHHGQRDVQTQREHALEGAEQRHVPWRGPESGHRRGRLGLLIGR